MAFRGFAFGVQGLDLGAGGLESKVFRGGVSGLEFRGYRFRVRGSVFALAVRGFTFRVCGFQGFAFAIRGIEVQGFSRSWVSGSGFEVSG